MKSLAVLEYMFIFDPTDTWQTGYQFEKDLSDFFGAHGYEAIMVETKGGSSRRLLFINRVADITEPKPKVPPMPKGKTQNLMKRVLDQHIEGLKK